MKKNNATISQFISRLEALMIANKIIILVKQERLRIAEYEAE